MALDEAIEESPAAVPRTGPGTHPKQILRDAHTNGRWTAERLPARVEAVFNQGNRGKVFNHANQYVYDRMVRHLKRRSQRHLRPPGDHTYYQFVYQRLGVARL